MLMRICTAGSHKIKSDVLRGSEGHWRRGLDSGAVRALFRIEPPFLAFLDTLTWPNRNYRVRATAANSTHSNSFTFKRNSFPLPRLVQSINLSARDINGSAESEIELSGEPSRTRRHWKITKMPLRVNEWSVNNELGEERRGRREGGNRACTCYDFFLKKINLKN